MAGIETNTLELTRNDYLILQILKSQDATKIILAMSTSEIQEELGELKQSGLWKHLNVLRQAGYIKQGGKSKRENTYYISELGIQMLED